VSKGNGRHRKAPRGLGRNAGTAGPVTVTRQDGTTEVVPAYPRKALNQVRSNDKDRQPVKRKRSPQPRPGTTVAVGKARMPWEQERTPRGHQETNHVQRRAPGAPRA
jgi:hypothetical protein